MPLIFRPNQVPGGIGFYIHNFMEKGTLLGQIISLAVPSSTCIGVCSDISQCLILVNNTANCVVSCDPNAYFSDLWQRPNFFFIPAAEGNYASFWHHGYVFLYHYLKSECGRARLQEYVQLASAGGVIAEPVSPSNPAFEFRRKHHPYFRSEWVRSRLKDIHLIHRHLADQNSRDAFMRYIYCDPLATLDYFLGSVLRKTQYFDYIQMTVGDVIINCGVDNGWELPFFLATTGNSTRIYNLDPSADTALSHYARIFVDGAPGCFSFHDVAVWSRDTKLSFGGNRVTEREISIPPTESLVNATTIDSFCVTHEVARVDLIKMDVEGAEPEAIKGMTDTIKRFRPQLALAIYHDENQEQALDIPLSIIENTHKYNFYLDTYNYDLGETIFYAIPSEKDRRKGDCLVVD